MTLRLTYLGCEGVLVRAGTQSVMIDGLFGDLAAPFGTPPPDRLQAIRHAQPPFDAVDVVMATHDHQDHFEPLAVADYLRASANTRFVSTPQAVARVVEAAGPSLSGRLHAVLPEEGVRETLDVNGVRIEVFGLSHGKVNYADVEHMGIVVRPGGRSLVHLGDGIIDPKSLRAAGVLDEPIDAGVLPFWFLTYPFGRRLIEDGFRPAAIFAVHILAAERAQVVNDIASWSDATALVEPLATYSVDDDGRVSKEE